MTTQELTRVVLPYARHALNEARPAVVEAVGRAGWVVLWPAWAVVTGPMLPVAVRIAIELAIGLAGPQLLPILEVINALTIYLSDKFMPESRRAFLVDLTWLLKMPREQMTDPVRSALSLPPGVLAGGGPDQ